MEQFLKTIIDYFAALNLPTIFEFVGTFAFAISGIRLASAKHFDWFGAYVVGLATAIGGGTFRDMMLGVTPFWMTDPIYLCWSGLALFTVVGIQKSIDCGFPLWVGIVMGTMTGAAGGVIRDVFINEIPLIFRKEIYAMACVIGGIVFGISMWLGADTIITHTICGVSVFLVRVLSVKYHICLPTLKGSHVE